MGIPLVSIMIQVQGKKHSVESRLNHALILGANHPGFQTLVHSIFADGSYCSNT